MPCCPGPRGRGVAWMRLGCVLPQAQGTAVGFPAVQGGLHQLREFFLFCDERAFLLGGAEVLEEKA